jgi:hypothetical protein
VVIHEVYKKHIIDGTCISFGPFVNNEDLLLIMFTFSKYTKETIRRGNQKGQSRINNPETLETFGTRHRMKTNKTKTITQNIKTMSNTNHGLLCSMSLLFRLYVYLKYTIVELVTLISS